jgi:hypothetical protein
MRLPVAPDVLHRVQFRGVRRKILARQAPLLGGDQVPDQATAMGRQAIPDHEDGTREVAQEMGEELHDLRTADRPRKQAGCRRL